MTLLRLRGHRAGDAATRAESLLIAPAGPYDRSVRRDAVVRALRAALVGRADVELALLFGSVARDAARDGSDVDVAVRAPGVDLSQLSAQLSAAVGAEVDLVDLAGATIPLCQALIRESIPFHEGRPGAEGGWRSSTLSMLETDAPAYARMTEGYLRRVAERARAG